MIIDLTYFHGLINIPQLSQPYVSDSVDSFIVEFERDILIKILGLRMYNAFMAGLTESVVEQRWQDLRDGVEYNNKEWMGFANSRKKSLIANYVYYWYTRDQVTQTTGVGESATKTENAVRVSPAGKQTRAWNEMVNWIADLYEFLKYKSADYPEFKPQPLICKINSLNL